jgi:plastocyanin
LLLKSVSLVVLLTLGSVPFSATAAWAEEHIIIILGSAYFPQHTIVEDGDIVRFVNVSGRNHQVTHAEEKWITHEMSDGDELLVEIEPDMVGSFYGMAKQLIVGRMDLMRQAASK